MFVGFDIDGVLIDSYKFFRRKIKEEYDYDYFDKDPNRITIRDICDEKVNVIINEFLIKHPEELEVYPDTVQCINQIYDTIKTPIKFVTARPFWTFNSTNSFIKNIFKDNIEYIVVCCDYPHMKYNHLENYNIFVEDNADNAIDLSKYVETVYLINRPMNLHVNVSNIHNVKRIDLMSDVYKDVKKKLNSRISI